VIKGNVVEVWWIANLVPINDAKPIPITEVTPLDRFLTLKLHSIGTQIMIGIPFRTLKKILQVTEAVLSDNREKEQIVTYLGLTEREDIATFVVVDYWGKEKVKGWFTVLPKA
jgi:hypothetical protein